MATATQLISLGTPAELALRLGWTEVAVTTTAATQGTGLLRKPGKKIVTATIASAGHAITLPSDAEIGDEIIISNVTANAGVVFPPSGGNINGETADENVALAAQGSAGSIQRFVKLNATRWGAWLNIAAD
jgi:hypothetical protein